MACCLFCVQCVGALQVLSADFDAMWFWVLDNLCAWGKVCGCDWLIDVFIIYFGILTGP